MVDLYCTLCLIVLIICVRFFRYNEKCKKIKIKKNLRIPSSFLLLFGLESNTEEKMGGGGKDEDVEVLFREIEDEED